MNARDGGGCVAMVEVAARLVGCSVEAVMAYRLRSDGALVVVVWPGAKYVFDQAALEAAAAAAPAEVEVREVLRGPLSESAAAPGVAVARRPRKPRGVSP